MLAIACANVANLLLGRGTSRRREIAVRLALGATRARIVRQLLTESVVLALAGSVVGLGLAWWAEKWLVSLSPAGVLRLSETSIDPVVLAFALLVAISTGLVFGALPAWQVSRSSPNEELKDGRGADGTPADGHANVLVALEIAVALALLVGAGLLLRSFNGLTGVDTGQEPSAGWQIVSRDYFDAIGMRVLSGRGFRDVDTAGSAPVVVVNETLARHAWGGRDGVGRRVRFSRDPGDAPTYIAAAGGLLAVSLLAAAVPARRAARIDGSRILRS